MEKLHLLRCKHCGKVIELLPGSHGCPTKCCGEPMEELVANSIDASKEKHVPAVNVESNVVSVVVGETIHPMMEAHHIGFIYLVTDKNVYRKDLKVNEEPKAEFALLGEEKPLVVYEYCNLHGLWKKEL